MQGIQVGIHRLPKSRIHRLIIRCSCSTGSKLVHPSSAAIEPRFASIPPALVRICRLICKFTDILARVQSFLPQIQRANAAIGHAAPSTSAFELIDQDTAELDAEAEADERGLLGEEEGEQGDVDPQIVMVSRRPYRSSPEVRKLI